MQIELSNRQKLVLKALLDEHIRTAAPVGSGRITEMIPVKLSSASVRNTLAELEEAGLIAKPHTSAGRVPTDSGYRYYVDYLMEISTLSEAEIHAINSIVEKGGRDFFEMLESMARVLAQLTHQLGIIVSPVGGELRLHSIAPHYLGGGRVALIITMINGVSRSVVLDIDREIDRGRLSYVVSIINRRLFGLPLDEIRKTIRERLEDVLSLRDTFITTIVDMADAVFSYGLTGRLHYHGATELLEQPEFQDFSRLRSVMKLIEYPAELVSVVSVQEPNAISGVRISRAIDGVAIVCGRYDIGGDVGVASIIGPPRMDYSRTIGILTCACKSLSKAFG
jgi:heat-inducible transcriptional repressor